MTSRKPNNDLLIWKNDIIQSHSSRKSSYRKRRWRRSIPISIIMRLLKIGINLLSCPSPLPPLKKEKLSSILRHLRNISLRKTIIMARVRAEWASLRVHRKWEQLLRGSKQPLLAELGDKNPSGRLPGLKDSELSLSLLTLKMTILICQELTQRKWRILEG